PSPPLHGANFTAGGVRFLPNVGVRIRPALAADGQNHHESILIVDVVDDPPVLDRDSVPSGSVAQLLRMRWARLVGEAVDHPPDPLANVAGQPLDLVLGDPGDPNPVGHPGGLSRPPSRRPAPRRWRSSPRSRR